MYINERDQINYHGFLRALREMHQIREIRVCKGICSESAMNRFENGNRVAEKLMRDRLTARLGISGEKYEDYLQPKEYVIWERRLRIVKAIEKSDLKTAKKELAAYEEQSGLNRIHVQFVEAMRYMILTLEGASEDELTACIQKAVKCTVSNVSKALDGEHLLADQEINLIAEQMRLCPPKKVVRDVNEWRISEYEKLIAYMDDSRWEKLQKAKVYPKVVYYICQCLLEKEMTEEECRRGLELCHTAIELLRDTSRLYYFIELTEFRRELATRLEQHGIPAKEKAQLDEMLTENNEWEKLFKGLYAQYEVAPYMSDFCYLYYETECHNMVVVIEARRNMLGLSRVRLGKGVCTERTIVRFEREGANPTIEMVRRLFDKMGLCAEYRRAPIITAHADVLMQYIKLINEINGLNEGAEKTFSEVLPRVDIRIPHNKQEFQRLNTLLEFKKRNITRKEMNEKAIETLEVTLPMKAVEKGLKKNDSYVTRAEMTCLYDIAFYGEGEHSDIGKDYINNKCNAFLNSEVEPSQISVFELLLSNYASQLGDRGDYEESNEISGLVLKECLSNRRMRNLSNNYYNILWNSTNIDHDLSENKRYMIAELEKCITLSKVIKDGDWIAFFQNKKDDLSN